MALKPLCEHQGIVVPFDRYNIDTDAILPKQYLKKLEADGFGGYLFDDERYLDKGDVDIPVDSRRVNPQFILNQQPYDKATVILARDNFGCGSSREHAVWAIRDYGIRFLVAPSYGDIFRNNCFNNGVLAIVQPRTVVDYLFTCAHNNPGMQLSVNVSERRLSLGDEHWHFELDDGRAEALMKGLDEVGLTLERSESIKEYERKRKQLEPWLF